MKRKAMRLTRETVRHLVTGELARVVGGTNATANDCTVWNTLQAGTCGGCDTSPECQASASCQVRGKPTGGTRC
jgi:hypothetical protein